MSLKNTLFAKNTTANKALSSHKYIQGYSDGTDDFSGHQKGMNVLMTDGAINWTDETELPEDEKLPEGLTR